MYTHKLCIIMLPLIVLGCLSTRLYYLQYNIYLTFPLRATLARNENTRQQMEII